MYCKKCGRWIDAHEDRDSGTCANEAKCEARVADPGFPGYYEASIAALAK